MTSTVFIFIILLSVLLAVLITVAVYLLDRLRLLEGSINALKRVSLSQSAASQSGSLKQVKDPYFYGLSGKRLWAVLESNSDPDYSDIEIEEVRARFIAILPRSLALIKDSVQDESVMSKVTTNSEGWVIDLRTLRGHIDLWLPIDIVDQVRSLSSLASASEEDLSAQAESVVTHIIARINAQSISQGLRSSIVQTLVI
ncbi:MAG: hypothetical protein CMQ41_02690 [Gammaproteobacteria bacterium]|nr:hypothetical protein [Gammaproteobacteria bacterium]|tara:strand:+ start:1120 stop:1716 length:597 start_codon:yes stop_codon:yes gene_type:complete